MRSNHLTFILLFFLAYCANPLFTADSMAQEIHSPDTGQDKTTADPVAAGIEITTSTPLLEWTYHKTADGLHPNGREQQIIWLMNRARSNPAREGWRLANSSDRDVASGRDYYGVDTDLLQNEFASVGSMQPASFDNRLYAAAYTHSTALIARDAQDHDGQGAYIRDNGFYCSSYQGNVFSYARSGLNAHAAWNIDWSSTGVSGMLDGRWHRIAVMSVEKNFSNIGVASILQPDPDAAVGPYVTTANHCMASTTRAEAVDHVNTFIVGTVWTDSNGNDQYDPGEGWENVTVTPDHGQYYAVTGASGGFSIPVATSGTYGVTFSRTNPAGQCTRTIAVADESVLLDIETSSCTWTVPPPVVKKQIPLAAIMLLLH